MPRCTLTILLVSAWMAPASAQSPQASISGTVQDAQGAVVPGVSVTAVNDDTGVKTAVRTNESGFYSLQALPVGSYTIRVEQEGFQSQVQAGIVLTTGQTLRLRCLHGDPLWERKGAGAGGGHRFRRRGSREVE